MTRLYVPHDYARPMAPLAFGEMVAQFGRRHGRTAVLKWLEPKQRMWAGDRWVIVDQLACWVIELSLRADAPALKAWRAGRLPQAEPPTESVMLIEWDAASRRYVPINLEDKGIEALRDDLERGDTWSGRGEFSSFAEAFAHARAQRRRAVENARRDARDWAVELGKAVRRQVHKIPFLGVGIDLREQQPT